MGAPASSAARILLQNELTTYVAVPTAIWEGSSVTRELIKIVCDPGHLFRGKDDGNGSNGGNGGLGLVIAIIIIVILFS